MKSHFEKVSFFEMKGGKGSKKHEEKVREFRRVE